MKPTLLFVILVITIMKYNCNHLKTLEEGNSVKSFGSCIYQNLYYSTLDTPLYWIQRSIPVKFLFNQEKLDVCWDEKDYFKIFIEEVKKDKKEKNTYEDILSSLLVTYNSYYKLRQNQQILSNLTENQLQSYLHSVKSDLTSNLLSKDEIEALNLYYGEMNTFYYSTTQRYFTKETIKSVLATVNEQINDISKAIRERSNIKNFNEIKEESFSVIEKMIYTKLKLPSFKAFGDMMTKCFQLKQGWILEIPTMIAYAFNKKLFNLTASVRLLYTSFQNFGELMSKIAQGSKEDASCIFGKIIANLIDAYYLLYSSFSQIS